MAQVTVRPYEDRDEEGFFEVRALTYNDGLPILERGDWRPNNERYVAESDGKIVGAFNVLPLTATRGPSTLRCGGVAGVAVAPDCRRGGVGGQMMRWYVNHARDQGVPMASLYGFRETWYRRFGYEVAGKRTRISCPTHRLPDVPCALDVRRLGWEDWAQLAPCYAEYAHARSGVNMREEEWQWKRVLAENKPLTIYAFGDPVEAYAAVSHSIAFWTDQHISELVWSTRRGYQAALSFLRQLGINKTAITWFEPSDSPFYAQYLDHGVEARIERPIMYRINDVVAAFRHLRPDGEGAFRMRVTDDTIAANDRVWQVEFASGEVAVTPGEDEDFVIDIRQLAQAFLGEPSLAELLRHGLVNVRRAGPLDDAMRLLPPSPTVCLDFF
ncbi:MAG: GNAT family N-acetyltransferase [Fimbriimonas sp.]